MLPRGLIKSVPDWLIEFPADTARTIASLLFSGTADRCRDIQFHFSHSGGALPSLIERFTIATRMAPELAASVPQGVLWYLRRFCYDTAISANPSALGALLRIVPGTQVMFGSDFPHRTASEQITQLESMNLGRSELEAILAGNAQRILGVAFSRARI